MSAGSVMGPKGLLWVCYGSVMGLFWVCEVELKNNGADFILIDGMKSVLFLLEGWGEWFFLKPALL